MLHCENIYSKNWRKWMWNEIQKSILLIVWFMCYNCLSSRFWSHWKCRFLTTTWTWNSMKKAWLKYSSRLSLRIHFARLLFICFVWYQLINSRFIKFDFLRLLLMSQFKNTKIFERYKSSRTWSFILWFRTCELDEIIFSKCWKKLIFCVIQLKNDLLIQLYSSFNVSN
jgi:hypothetical protein